MSAAVTIGGVEVILDDARAAVAAKLAERGWLVANADSREWLSVLADASVDALVCDPPAGIAFMGKEWDDFKPAAASKWAAPNPEQRDGTKWNPGTVIGRGFVAKRCVKCGRQAWSGSPCVCPTPEWDNPVIRERTLFIAGVEAVFAECLRVLKPGAHGLVWALPRTSHWTATALEDAGFEIRDVVNHAFGTGYPKSKNLPGGLGTALKPAAENWILVRKPLVGTVAANVQAFGTGALNINASRIGSAGGGTDCSKRDAEGNCLGHENAGRSTSGETFHGPNTSAGRFPANFVLSHSEDCVERGTREVKRDLREVAPLNPDVDYSPTSLQGRVDGSLQTLRSLGSVMETAAVFECAPGCPVAELDRQSGSASRFFYVAKPSGRERNMGGTTNTHPTVKSKTLMDYLIRLITPPGGVVLDPFTGSGSTGVAAVAGGWRFIGIEREAEYVKIARARIAAAVPPPAPAG